MESLKSEGHVSIELAFGYTNISVKTYSITLHGFKFYVIVYVLMHVQTHRDTHTHIFLQHAYLSSLISCYKSYTPQVPAILNPPCLDLDGFACISCKSTVWHTSILANTDSKFYGTYSMKPFITSSPEIINPSLYQFILYIDFDCFVITLLYFMLFLQVSISF